MTRTISMTSALIGGLAAFAMAGCGNQEPESAEELFEIITAADYQSWPRAPGYEMRQPSASPHGDAVEIFVNDVVQAALDAGESLDAWPVGSLIVKDSYDDDDHDKIDAMEKRADGWFWAQWRPDGRITFSGSPNACTNCHAGGDDFVLAFDLP